MTSFYNENGLALEKYFVGLYEKEVEGNITRHINYIMAGDGITAIVIEEEENGNTTSETYFTYKDHLGSIVALTDVNGDVVLEQSFDAWGRYRNPNDWTYNNVNESPTWLRGYTGHEHLPHFDLINMNGRIYDPILGRMLSPDRFVSDPLSTQGYNRYAYVLNNPLRYSDPSGDFPVAAAIIGTVAGAYIGGSIVNNSFRMSEWSTEGDDKWKTLAGIGVGAVSGFFGGWGVGSKIASKTISAKQLGGNTLAGVINARYNYEEGQGVLTSMGYFSAGFLGSQIGIEGGVLYGLHGGGIMTAIVGATHMPDEYQGYYLAQKYVGGALSSYAGMTFTNPDLGYLKRKGNYLFGSKSRAKGASYAIQNIAQRFAYTDRKYYLEAGLIRNLVNPAMIGWVSGLFHYEANTIKDGYMFKGEKDLGNYLNRIEVGKYANKFGYGLAAYGFDYAWNTLNSGKDPFSYDAFSKKAAIGLTKSIFYYLILK